MGVTYPGDPNGIPVAPSYTYTYDGMGRLNTMTDGTGATIVNGATYNAAGQMLSGVDTRTYNSMGQLTSVTSSTSLNITYTYPNAGQNNGKIASQHDNISGETVSYLYDTLNRLTSATGSGWNQGFVYDPFGNLTDKNGSNSWHGVPDASTNHLGSVDANGNALSSTSATGLAYDPENRLISANYSYQQYAYDAQNKRIWAVAWDNTHSFYTSETYYFYSPQGKVMAQFTPAYQQQNGTLAFMNGAARSYFGGRLLGTEDRLGSRGTYFPYGEDRGSQNPANDNVKFGTYTRDSATVLDYADQRYYAATYGRFLTPDPYSASGGPSDPGSWNRYSYTRGDPVNRVDRHGRCDEPPEESAVPRGTLLPSAFYEPDEDCDPCEETETCEPGPVPPPPPPPTPDEPDCWIELWQRPTPKWAPVGVHTYLFITGTNYQIGFMVEAGPVDGMLTGQINPPGQGLGKNTPYPSDPYDAKTNKEVGSPVFDPGCDDTIAILNDVNGYNSGKKEPYAALGTTNSNAFTFTLLAHVGMAWQGSSLMTPTGSVFGNPSGFAPGWGQVIW